MPSSIDTNLILDSLEQNIFVKDLRSKYLFVNNTYAKLVDQKASDMIAKDDYEFFPEDIADKYRKDDAFVMKNEEVIDTKENIMVEGEN